MTEDRDDAGPNDRFGISDRAIRAAVERHCGIWRDGLYVPTRSEVRTAPIEWLASVLMDWIWESPSELIPNDHQIEEVIAVLQSRPDATTAEMERLIAELRGG